MASRRDTVRFPTPYPSHLRLARHSMWVPIPGTGVNDADYQTPFPFDGKLNSLTLKLLPPG